MSEHKKCDCGHESEEPQTCNGCDKTFCEDCFTHHISDLAIDKDGKPITVKLTEAFYWFCDNCGHFNVIKMIRRGVHDADLTEKQTADLKEILDLDEWQDIPEDVPGSLVQIPAEVSCQHCHLVFMTLPPTNDLLPLDPDDEDIDDGHFSDE